MILKSFFPLSFFLTPRRALHRAEGAANRLGMKNAKYKCFRFTNRHKKADCHSPISFCAL